CANTGVRSGSPFRARPGNAIATAAAAASSRKARRSMRGGRKRISDLQGRERVRRLKCRPTPVAATAGSAERLAAAALILLTPERRSTDELPRLETRP